MLRICLSLLLLTVSINTWSASIEGLRLSQSKENTRLVFDLNRSVKYTIFTLSNPERIVIDLIQTIKPSYLKIPDLNQSPLHSIRYAAWDKNTLRIVLDLKHPLKYESQTLAPNQGYPHRLVIDLRSTVKSLVKEIKVKPKPVIATVITPSDPIKTVTTAPVKTVTTTPVKTVTPPQVTPKPAEIIITKPEPIMTVTKSTKTMPKRQIIIAIDAGHGGQDSGALGRGGTKEKTVVLAIAKRLAKLVNKEPGMRAYLTRDRDIFITLRQRIKRARNNNADMFISIHADAFKNTKARGASVFVLSERGASSEAAQLLADKENAADLAGGISLEDKDDLLASVLLDLSQTASLEASLEVANTVLSGLKRVGNVHKKHVESASFVVLKSPDIPSVLVETAFISNPAEERKLKSSSHQNKLARAMMSGIRNYFQRNPLPGSTIPQQHTVSRGDTLSIIAHRYQVSMTQLKQANDLKTSNIKIGEVLLIP
ncbi:MAG: AMIN domain-containing protein [Methylophaga sp.]|nr:AMIN domain-containing protein [Methylophaga sp.]